MCIPKEQGILDNKHVDNNEWFIGKWLVSIGQLQWDFLGRASQWQVSFRKNQCFRQT